MNVNVDPRVISVLIGYVFGCFLTAEAVAHRFSGKKASLLGETGNPGMANIMASLGFVPGIITLAGDLGKVIAASLISHALFPEAGWIVVLYAGLGATLGHDFPFWRRFRGGKGVATTSMAIVLYSFWPGLAANIAGMLVVFVTKYLCIGGPVIPAVFAAWMLAVGDKEAALIGAVLTVLSVLSHGKSILGIRKGKTSRTDVLALMRKKKKIINYRKNTEYNNYATVNDNLWLTHAPPLNIMMVPIMINSVIILRKSEEIYEFGRDEKATEGKRVYLRDAFGKIRYSCPHDPEDLSRGDPLAQI